MPKLRIITGADTPILRAKTKRVAKVTKEVLKLIKDMEQTLIAVDGLGLAAPQINESLRLCLAKIGGRITPLINPDVTWRSREMMIAEEGCLSLPGDWANVPRAIAIIVKYQNARGQEQERKLSDLEARIVQHEVDHLEGILIVDYKLEKVTMPTTQGELT